MKHAVKNGISIQISGQETQYAKCPRQTENCVYFLKICQLCKVDLVYYFKYYLGPFRWKYIGKVWKTDENQKLVTD